MSAVHLLLTLLDVVQLKSDAALNIYCKCSAGPQIHTSQRKSLIFSSLKNYVGPDSPLPYMDANQE